MEQLILLHFPSCKGAKVEDSVISADTLAMIVSTARVETMRAFASAMPATLVSFATHHVPKADTVQTASTSAIVRTRVFAILRPESVNVLPEYQANGAREDVRRVTLDEGASEHVDVEVLDATRPSELATATPVVMDAVANANVHDGRTERDVRTSASARRETRSAAIRKTEFASADPDTPDPRAHQRALREVTEADARNDADARKAFSAIT